MTIPDKGSHYLKKSPSPTGSKPPPGEGAALSPVAGSDDGSPVKKQQQVRSRLMQGADLVLIEMLICQRFLARHPVSFLRREVFPDQERILIEKIMREKEKVTLEGSRK